MLVIMLLRHMLLKISFVRFVALKDRDSARFVTKFVQAATNRKTRKSSHRKCTLSSTTPDTLSLDSSTVCGCFLNEWPSRSSQSNRFFYTFQSAESKDQKTTFISEKQTHQIRRASANDDAMKSRLSEDESNDSAFADNGECMVGGGIFWLIGFLFVERVPIKEKSFFFAISYYIHRVMTPFLMNFLHCILGRLWFSQNKIYGVGLNRVSLQNTRPKTIHWAEVYSNIGFLFLRFFFFLFKIFFCIIV